MAKKQWYDLFVWREGMEKPELVAKVKSAGLYQHACLSFANLYEFVGPEKQVDMFWNMSKQIEGNIK